MNVRSRIKTVLTIAVVTLALMAVSASAVEVIGEFGILDVSANGGINPNTGVAWAEGDQYRLAFHTAGKHDAASTDPAVYNAWVTAQAQLNLSLAGSTWTAMISTVTINVKVNTGTGGAGGFPVYAMDGSTCIARNNADIWNAWSNPFDGDSVIRIPAGTGSATQNVHYSPFLDQHGLGDSGNVHGVEVWTGAQVSGSNLSGQEVGHVPNTNWGSSNANNTARVWNRGNGDNTALRSIYALSEVLTVQDANADPNLPDVEAVDNWITWSGEPVTINATVIDNDTQGRTLEYAWTDDAPVGFTVEIVDGVTDPEDATITITKDGDTDDATVVTITLAVTLDGVGTKEDSFTIDVYDDACRSAVAVSTEVVFDPADFNKDCITDIKDIAIMAVEWLEDYSLTVPLVAP